MKKLFLLIFTWWNGQTLGTWWYTARRGRNVGTDELGNRYFVDRNDRRWVIYNGLAEASRVPPGWSAWLHHNGDVTPTEAEYRPRVWEKPHLPNMTGSPAAYRPQGSILTTESRPRVTGDYEPWKP